MVDCWRRNLLLDDVCSQVGEGARGGMYVVAYICGEIYGCFLQGV